MQIRRLVMYGCLGYGSRAWLICALLEIGRGIVYSEYLKLHS